MNPRINDGGLQYPLTDTAIIPPSLRTHHRRHDVRPGYVYRGVPISVIDLAAVDATEVGLALAVRFCTMTALRARFGRLCRINCVQWDTSKSGLVGEEETELPEGPGGMLRSLGFLNRAFRALTDVP